LFGAADRKEPNVCRSIRACETIDSLPMLLGAHGTSSDPVTITRDSALEAASVATGAA
jgi:hypothetical protein